MFKKIENCRICGNKDLRSVLALGSQMLTGVFPHSKSQKVTSGPLELLKCFGAVDATCGLLQLSGAYDLQEMYGLNYGYRSGLNSSMVTHLKNKVDRVLKLVDLKPGDLVIDIGSNDGTTLKCYEQNKFALVGIDPTIKKFKDYYPSSITMIEDFFSAKLIKNSQGGKKAKIVTSFSMFYDLDDPIAFMRDISEVLDANGVWIFEQSYMPSMLKTNSYDTACHEHLEYYALRQIKWMTDKLRFKIVDVEFNEVNGGSFSISLAKEDSHYIQFPELNALLKFEKDLNLDQLGPYQKFSERVEKSKRDLLDFLAKAKSENKMVAALGASTKGNVLLQYCGLGPSDIKFVGEVNAEKFGCYTPGTYIPIIPEDELLAMKPDYLLVLPWHFKSFFVNQKKLKGFNLVFPLPDLEIVTVN